MAAKKKAKKSAKKTAKKAAPKRSAKRAPAKKAARRAAAKPSHPTVVHWEIQAKDAPALHRFYSDLFGWKIDAKNPMNYGMVTSSLKSEGINGGIGPTMSGSSRVLVYAAVDDIVSFLGKAESLGAKTILPRTAYGPVTMGIFEDTEGNLFGVVENE